MRGLAYRATVGLLRAPFLPFSRVRVLHEERARVAGPCILAANHISHFDPPFIASVIRRRVAWMTTAGLLRVPIIGGWLRFIGCFPVDRTKPDRASVRRSLALLDQGRMVGIFPEGGIRDGSASILGGATPIPGLGALAQMGGAPILPCVVLGTDRLYARRSYAPFFRTPVWLGFGSPISVAGSGQAARDDLEERYPAAMRALFQEMCGHFGLSDDDFPKSPQERMKGPG